METENKNINNFQKYGELWSYNLRKITEIHNDIESTIQKLENKYSDFESIYNKIDELIGILSTIYSSYNSIKGIEYIMRLKAVIQSYKKRYTREGFNFDLLNFLLLKISDIRDKSLEKFPLLSHDNKIAELSEEKGKRPNYLYRPYKWITFARHKSCFITPFKSIDIKHNDNYEIISFEKPDYIHVNIDNRVTKIKDIFSKSTEYNEIPKYYILLNKGKNNFAAAKIGKRIFSGYDIITPKIKPFAKAASNSLSPGRIRIFGENHIVIQA